MGFDYTIGQDSDYKGHGYWRWWAWIDAEGDALDHVEQVAWILHPTFRVQRVISTDRATQFRLETSGWGTFALKAELTLASGETLTLRRHLRLEYPEAEGTQPPTRPDVAGTEEKPYVQLPPSRPLTLYLSYGSQDGRLAAKLKQGLETSGIQWVDPSSVKAGSPMAEGVERLIAQADAVVGIVGDDEVSPWVVKELETGLAAAKPSVALVTEGTSPTGLPTRVELHPFPQGKGAALMQQFMAGLKLE